MNQVTPITPNQETLTPDQEALCDEIVAEYDRELDNPRAPDLEVIKKWIGIVYNLFEIELPPIQVVHSPYAALRLASDHTGTLQSELDWTGVTDAGWVARYDYYHRTRVLSDEEAHDVMALRDYLRVAWDSVLLDELAIVIAQPEYIRRDDQGNLHCAGGPAIRWRDGESDYCWHGIWTSEQYVMNPKSVTREEYLAIDNTEQRRILGESAGWNHIMALIGASTTDTWADPKTRLQYELLKSESGETWLRKQSPVLQDGTQPDYVEPVHEDLKTACGARRWQVPPFLGAAECDASPALEYEIET